MYCCFSGKAAAKRPAERLGKKGRPVGRDDNDDAEAEEEVKDDEDEDDEQEEEEEAEVDEPDSPESVPASRAAVRGSDDNADEGAP